MYMYYVFDSHIYSFSSVTTYIFPIWQAYFFFFIYANNFKIVHTCVSIWNTSAHELLSDSHKYFTSVSHIFPSHLWPLKYSIFGSLLYCHEVFMQFINTVHFADIFVLSHQWQLICSLFGRHMYLPFLIYANNFWNYTQLSKYMQ